MTIKEIPASETWAIRHKVMWPAMSLEFVQLKEDDLGIHFGVYNGSKLVAIVSCFEDNNEMQFRKLATLNSYQGKGIASLLLKYIFNIINNNYFKNIIHIWISTMTENLKKTF